MHRLILEKNSQFSDLHISLTFFVFLGEKIHIILEYKVWPELARGLTDWLIVQNLSESADFRGEIA